MDLKPRFMLLTTFVFIITAIGVSMSALTFAEDIIEQWASRFVVRQALYDKNRTLQPILRELAISRQLASSSIIIDWASNPDDPITTQKALKELESYRLNFRDQNYFVALLNNGHYYHNNATNQYQNNEFRYILDPDKEADSWFYQIIEQKRDIHINVNPDEELGITKLWIDVLIKDGEHILGMAGTGLELSDLLVNVLVEQEPGIHSLFVDHAGAIQLHRDKTLIDYSTISKRNEEHKTLDLIFEDDSDKNDIRDAMEQLALGNQQVVTKFINFHGQRQLMGMVYLPEIDWYEITLIDTSSLLPLSQFFKIILIFVTALLSALILLHFVLTRLMLNPISQLDKAMELFEKGKNPAEEISISGKGELSRLGDHFFRLAQSVFESKRDLEQKVKDRTAALERLTKIDPLTELYNRRGMMEQLTANLNRTNREKSSIGILWLDIDWFKEINDTYGHAVGDEALKAVAKTIKETIRAYDLPARWGGDEFLILIFLTDFNVLMNLAERLRERIASHVFEHENVSLSVSIGCALSSKKQDIDTLLQNADQALYKAKENGRNQVYAYKKVANKD